MATRCLNLAALVGILSILLTCGHYGSAEISLQERCGATFLRSHAKCAHPSITNGKADLFYTPGALVGNQGNTDYDLYHYGNYGDYGNYDDTVPTQEYELDTRMQVQCNDGYVYNMTKAYSGKLYCVAKSKPDGNCVAVWSDDVTTLCSPILCNPKRIKRGILRERCNSTGGILESPIHVNRTACMTCKYGYKLSQSDGGRTDSQVITCGKDGDWKLPTQCENILSCTRLRAPDFGSIQDYDPKRQLTFTCDPGHILVGSQRLECEAGDWNGVPPICRNKDSCRKTSLYQGQISVPDDQGGQGEWAIPGANATYTCNTNYTHLTNGAQIRCVGGSWMPLARCVPDEPGKCPVLPRVANGSLTLTPSRILPGTVAEVTCRDSFSLIGSPRRVCQNTGKWSGENTKCQLLHHCSAPPTMANAEPPSAPGPYVKGARHRYICQPGYEFHGMSSWVTCTDSGWTAAKMRCRKVHCGVPPSIPNAIYDSNDFSFGNKVTYRCRPGYKKTSGILNDIVCQTNKRWTVISLKCSAIRCTDLPHIDHATLEARRGGAFRFNSIYRYTCHRGFKINNTKEWTEVKCERNESWSGQIPSCEVVKCPPLKAPDHGSQELVQGNGLDTGSLYKVKCDRSHRIKGARRDVNEMYRSCNAEAKWTTPEVICEKRNVFISHREWSAFLHQRRCCSPYRTHGYEWDVSRCPLHPDVYEECHTWGMWDRDNICHKEELRAYSGQEREDVWLALRGVTVSKYNYQCCWKTSRSWKPPYKCKEQW